MKDRWRSVRILFVVLLFLIASAANAELTHVYSGCYACSGGLFASCVEPDNNSWGSDTCTETTSDIQTCELSGYGCYYTEVSGGDGTGGGGGGGWDCSYQGGYCPIECMSCGQYY